MSTIPKVLAHFETTLAAKISAVATSFEFTSVLDKASGSLSGYYGVTFDEGASSEEEMLVTVSGTTATITVRGIDPASPLNAVTALKFEHSRGASIKFTNYPILGILRDILNGTLTVPNHLAYESNTSFLTSEDIVSKRYVDTTAISGAPDASTTVKGIIKTSVAPASPTSPIAVGDNDPRVPTSSQTAALVGNNTDIAVSASNKMVTQTGLQHGAELYAADTSGSTTAYVAALSPVPTSVTTGMRVKIKFVNANSTTTPTLALTGTVTAKTIVKGISTALVPGDIGANQIHDLVYDGTNWVLQTPGLLDRTTPTQTFGQLTRSTSGTVVVTHGMTLNGVAVAPKTIELDFAEGAVGGANTGRVIGHGISDGTNHKCQIECTGGGSGTTVGGYQYASVALDTGSTTGKSNYLTATVTTITTTQFSIVFTASGSPGTGVVSWKANP